jgi:hypothetical protein
MDNMPAETNSSTLYLQVDTKADIAPEQLDHLVRQLRRDISELEVESVEPVRIGALPAGAKSADALALGSLAVVLLPSLLPKLIDFLQNWLLRGENQNVKLKLQVAGNAVEVEYAPSTMSAADIQRLVGKLTGAVGKRARAS